MNRVGKLQRGDAVRGIRNQRLAAEQMGGKCFQNADMLLVPPVQGQIFLLNLRLEPGVFAVKTDVPLALRNPPAQGFAVFADQGAPFTGDFQPIRTGTVTGGGYKGAGGAVLEFQIGGDLVLHLNMMPFALVTEGGNQAGPAAEPEKEIQLMRALI